MVEIIDDNFAISNGWGRIEHNSGGWSDGDVLTSHGIVSVYAQGDDKCVAWTKLDFVYGGRCYVRAFRGKRYSHRGIVTKAKQFAEEIALSQFALRP